MSYENASRHCEASYRHCPPLIVIASGEERAAKQSRGRGGWIASGCALAMTNAPNSSTVQQLNNSTVQQLNN
jgi:hypothetical protein